MMEQSNNSYPMIPEKNWWTIRDKFKATIPTAVTASYVKTLLTMGSEDSAKNNVIVPMRRMGLIDAESKPTSLANDWRLDEKYKSACDEIIKKVYPPELLELFPEDEVDRNAAKSWFMSKGVGESAASKMVALFILLKSGEIRERKDTNISKSRATQKVKTIKSKTEKKKEETENNQVINTIAQNNAQNFSNQPNLHIDLQIHISPESSLEQIEAIFASMAKHLYGENK